MKLIERLVWSRCNNVASGDEWFKAQRTRKDSLCLSRSQTRLTFRPQDLFPWSLTLIMWDLLILKFMNSQSNCLICFISRVLDFCPGNALFQLRNIWGCLALPCTDIIITATIQSIHPPIHPSIPPWCYIHLSVFSSGRRSRNLNSFSLRQILSEDNVLIRLLINQPSSVNQSPGGTCDHNCHTCGNCHDHHQPDYCCVYSSAG